MAIKISNVTVIDDSKVIGSSSSGNASSFSDVNFTDFHPDVDAIPSSGAISFGDGVATTLQGKTVYTFVMTQNLQFTKEPAGAFSTYNHGQQFTIFLDRSATLYTPTFGSEFLFTSTPAWGSDRYWTISGVVWPDGNVRMTAVPFDAVTTPSSSFSNFGGGLGGNILWNSTQNSYGSGTPAAWASIAFLHNPANNRVNVTTTGGNSIDGSTQNTIYANYTGLTGITSVEVQYNPGSQSCSGSNCGSNSGQGYGPLPTDDGKAAGTYYSCASSQAFFGWTAEVDSSSLNDSHTYATFNSSDPDFRIKIVCNEGTFYSTGNCGSLSLFCNFGPTPGFNPGPGI